jgi:hypothetical protein
LMDNMMLMIVLISDWLFGLLVSVSFDNVMLMIGLIFDWLFRINKSIYMYNIHA